MNKDNQEFVNSLLQRLAKLNYIKPGDVPNIDLYMVRSQHYGRTFIRCQKV